MSMLDQARLGIQRVIAESPSVLTINRRPLITNALGAKVFDMTATPVPYKFKGRLAHERTRVQRDQEMPSGLDTNLSSFLVADYSVTLYEGETFELFGATWTIGKVEYVSKFGETIAVQAPLTRGQI